MYLDAFKVRAYIDVADDMTIERPVSRNAATGWPLISIAGLPD